MRSNPKALCVGATSCFMAVFFLCCNGDVVDDDAGSSRRAAGQTCPLHCDQPPVCSPVDIESCCQCVQAPSLEAERCSPEICSEGAGGGAADLACFGEDRWSETAIPGELVRLIGVVDVFSTGDDTTEDILVEVYEMNEQGALGTLVGEFLTGQDRVPCEDREDVLSRFLVESGAEQELCSGSCSRLEDEATAACRKLGFFRIDDVPTHVPLVVVTSGGDSWRPMYTFDVMFFEDDAVAVAIGDEPVMSPTIYAEVRALSRGDYYWLAIESGLGRAITEGNGAVIGEVRDCAGVRIRNVQVGISPRPELMTYFNGDEGALQPDGVRRHGTNWLGLFAGLDIDPDDNPVHVTAVGLVDDVPVSLGWATVRVYPGSLTVVALRGTLPGRDILPETTDVP